MTVSMSRRRSSASIQKPIALITGASSGIGRELAKVFAGRGYDLVLVSRNKKAMDELASELRASFNTTAIVLARDLSKHGAAEEIFTRLRRKRVEVEVLVNNAGFGTFGPFVQTETPSALDLLQVNIVALTHLTRLFAAEMVKRGKGKILNVASTAAFQPGPWMATYYASKSYVLAFSEALAHELAGSGVTVSCLCPGPTRTDFQRRAGMEHTRLVHAFSMMDAGQVAQRAYEGLMNGKRVIIPGLLNRIGTVLARIVPHSLIMNVIQFLHRKKT
jgi:short-subunit dehydrogenase